MKNITQPDTSQLLEPQNVSIDKSNAARKTSIGGTKISKGRSGSCLNRTKETTLERADF